MRNERKELARAFVEKTDKNIFLTGKAGTGKTTFLRMLQDNCSKRLVVVAPTGVAAINARGVTIHSFFQLSFGVQLPDKDGNNFTGNRNVHHFRKDKINILKSLDLLIIDEISMVRADLLDAIDETLRRYKNRRLPFGGVQLLMIGDLQQLAPIVRPEEQEILKTVYDTPFFFSSKALQLSGFISIELTKVYRQKDEKFIRILNDIRDGKLTKFDRIALDSRYDKDFSPDKYKDYIVLTTHNRIADDINKRELAAVKGSVFTYSARVEGSYPDYSYPTESVLKLKVGARVMFVKNDPKKQFYNGKIGTVVKLDKNVVSVKCEGDQDSLEIQAEEWDNYNYSLDKETDEIIEKSIGKFSQIPLKLAWAVTIHKSQGLTFDNAVIDAKSSFAYGQVYVALSRCRSLEGVVLSSPISERGLFSDKFISDFTSKIEAIMPDQQQLLSCENEYACSLVKDFNDFSGIAYRMRYIMKIISENISSVPSNVQKSCENSFGLFEDKIISISDTFDHQLQRLMYEEPDITKNELLNQRIEKASEYYIKQFEIVESFIAVLCFDVDNKVLRKSLRNATKNLAFDYKVKKACLKSVSKGMDVEKYLKARAVASLDKNVKLPESVKKTSDVVENLKYPELYNLLRKWRDEISKENNVACYQVIQVKSMMEIAETLPQTTADLKQIKGIGKKKLDDYGKQLLDLVANYVETNGINFVS
ncbi:MAG: AAA family ATPase [Prolixibacteraceae bacterium]|nr:AAA family ATPase [Prolixibacteraceae bacterium]